MKVQTKYRKDDQVIVRTGKFKGQTGKIESISKDGNRVFVSGVNLWKRHLRPNMDPNHQEGGIVDKAKSLHISNIGLVDPKTNKATRIGFKVEDGKKTRIAKSSGTML